jgi:hypothetical protein
MSTTNIRSRSVASVAAIGAALGALTLIIAPTAAPAFPDARVEATLRPNFGLLLRPPLHHHHHLPWGGGYGGGYGGGEHWLPHGWDHDRFGPDHGLAVLRIDCSDPVFADPNAVNFAVAHLRPGGTLYLYRSNSYPTDSAAPRTCAGPIVADKPMTIQGDMHDADVQSPLNAPAVLSVAGGSSCIEISSGGGDFRRNRATPEVSDKVVIKNLVVETRGATDDACIDARDSGVEIDNSVIRYDGGGSALYAAGGWLSTDGALVISSRRGVMLEDVGKASLKNTDIVSYAGDVDSGGLVVKGHYQGPIDVNDSVICGFKLDVYQEGPSTLSIDDATLCRTSEGIYAAGSGGSLSVTNSLIASRGDGIRIGSEIVQRIANNYFFDDPAGDINFVFPDAAPGRVAISGNHFMSVNDNCRWRDVDDDYFPRRRRPGGHGWENHQYMRGWHHRAGWGDCEDPGNYGNPFNHTNYREAFWFGQKDDPYAYVTYYGAVAWPDRDAQVPMPYDHYDGSQWWRRKPDGGPR